MHNFKGLIKLAEFNPSPQFQYGVFNISAIFKAPTT